MSKKVIHKIAFFAVIIMLSTLIISVAPAFALDSYTLTAQPDQSSYVQGAIVTVTGTLTDNTTSSPGANLMVGVKVTDAQANVVFQTIAMTNATGKYSTSFSHQLGASQPTGTYTIVVTASDGATPIAMATKTFAITDANPTPTPTPSPSPTPTASPTPTPSPSPTPTATPSPTPDPTATPTQAPTPTPTHAPTATPTPTVNPATTTPSPSPSPTVPEFPIAIVALIAVIATATTLLAIKQTKHRVK